MNWRRRPWAAAKKGLHLALPWGLKSVSLPKRMDSLRSPAGKGKNLLLFHREPPPPVIPSADENQVPSRTDTPLHRKTERKKRVLASRTCAVLGKPAQGKTYAELLKSIKNSVDPHEHKVEFKSIRKTRDGGVLLELDRNSGHCPKFTAAVKAAVGTNGAVKDLTPTVTVEIRDVDETSTVEDVRTALVGALGEAINLRRVGLSKPSDRGQRTAFADMDGADAEKLLTSGRIKIGWMNCRIRLSKQVTRCYRCLNFGHVSRSCSGPDRSKLCYRCGTPGHTVASCSELPHCVLCTALNEEGCNTDHVLGTGACAVFRRALASLADSTK